MSLNEQTPSYPAQQSYPGATPPPPPPPAPRPWSALAITGLVLSWLAPVGFLLSLIAIFVTGKNRKRGRGLAVTGLIISTLLLLAGIGGIVVASQWRVFDPGCTAGKAAILDSPDASDPANLPKSATALKAAAAKAEHDDVRAALTALADDYAQMDSAVKTGNLPPDLEKKVTADGEKLDALCTIGG